LGNGTQDNKFKEIRLAGLETSEADGENKGDVLSQHDLLVINLIILNKVRPSSQEEDGF